MIDVLSVVKFVYEEKFNDKLDGDVSCLVQVIGELVGTILKEYVLSKLAFVLFLIAILLYGLFKGR